MAGAHLRRAVALAPGMLLAACASTIPEPGLAPLPPLPATETARALPLSAGPALSRLRIAAADAAAALAAFRESCPKLLIRKDASGLATGSHWQAACKAATITRPGKARAFFARHFETLRVGSGEALATGYFEPVILGARNRLPGLDVPVYGLPDDLLRARPGDAEPLASGAMPLGRYDSQGRFRPYFTRAEIEDGALAGRGLEIAWVADAIDFFFLQIQGSGRLVAPDGSVMRIGYAGQNGHPYTAIGALMRARGLLGDGPGQYPASMQGIMRYLRDRPEEGRALMRENASWVFFRELGEDGPLGALGVPVRPGSSIAVDPRFVPLGAPVWLDLDRNEADGLWIAQDTGGAIRGANRFDTFWGAGEDAAAIAGGMQGRGTALLLLPKGSRKRLGVR